METIRVIENDRKIRDHITYYRIEKLPNHPLYAESGMNLGGYICKDSTIKEAAVLVNSSILDREVEVFDSEISGSTSLYLATDTPGAIIKNSEISGLEGSNNNIKLIENSRIIGAWKCSNEYGIEIVDSVIIGSGIVGGKLNGVWKS